MAKDDMEREASIRDRMQKRGQGLFDMRLASVVTGIRTHKNERAYVIGVHSPAGTNWRIMVKHGVAEAVDMIDTDFTLERELLTIPIFDGDEGDSGQENPPQSPIIAAYDVDELNGQWVPAVEVYVDEPGHQGFVLHDGTQFNRYPVDRSGENADLSDKQFRIDQWKSLNTHEESDGE